MNRMTRVAIVLLLVAGIAAVIVARRGSASPAIAARQEAAAGLPRVVDFGANKCVPCKLMAPILEELKKEYAGRMQVEFVDVWEDEAAGEKYGIEGIPTQIFFDASGKEVFRHSGFMAKADILAKCRELGFALDPAGLPKPASAPAAPDQSTTQPTPGYVADLYPGLASAALRCASPADLPEGVLMQCSDMRVTEADVATEIANAPEDLRPQLTANTFFVVEQMAARPLMLNAARQYVAQSGTKLSDSSDAAVLGAYKLNIMQSVQVSEAEITAFYEANKEMCGGATLGQIRDQLAMYVRQQKQQEAVQQQIRNLGRRMPIQVSARWAAQQAQAARDNPVDLARASGTLTMVDFGADGCRPCDMMAPILESLRAKYAGKVKVMFVHVRKEPVLAARYGIDGIPVQVFFDASGTEVYRHSGYYPQAEIEKRLQAMGVK